MSTTEFRVDIPHLPRHDGALEQIPPDITKQWAETYESAYRAAVASGKGAENFIHSIALTEANKLLTVPQPTNHQEALDLPKWQVMKREERIYRELPEHLKRRVDDAPKYLHVVTVDGKEHVFPILD